MSQTDTNDESQVQRLVTVIQLQADKDMPGFTTFFEPEGGERFIAPGDHLTITFDTNQPQEIDITMHNQSLVISRPTDGNVKVAIVDRRTGEDITNLW